METDMVMQSESPSVARGVGSVGGTAPSGVIKSVTTPQGAHQKPGTIYSQTNPYVSSQMYSSSFMSQEGSQSIQSLIGIEGHVDYTHGQTAAGVPYQQVGRIEVHI